MYTVKSKENSYQVEFKGKEVSTGLIDGDEFDFDMISTGDATFHLIQNNKSYNVEVLEAKAESKEFRIRVNGNEFSLTVKDKYDNLLEELGMSNLNTAKVANLKAPMPGLVLDILVGEGDEVKKGDGLIVLEAMKMENILKSPADALVKSVEAEKGSAVEKNTVLLNFE